MNFSRKKLIIVQVKKLLRNYFKTSSQIDGKWRKEETSSASRSVKKTEWGDRVTDNEKKKRVAFYNFWP